MLACWLVASVLVTAGLGTATAQSIEGSNLEVEASDSMAAELLSSAQAGTPGSADDLMPFGSRLFTGGFGAGRVDILNPDYILQPGDRVSVRIWGATELNQSVALDPQGNIFLPTVGPIALAGTANRNINKRVSEQVGTVYTNQVQVYASLDGSQPVGVFVTGFVQQPGRYGGVPSSSVLHFLSLAGGVETEQGSYRRVRVVRNEKTIANVDLYRFLVEGELPRIQFKDGDTIVVDARGSIVSVSGDVRSPAIYELAGESIEGEELLRTAVALPGASHVGVSGVREGLPFSDYMPKDVFARTDLLNGDQVVVRIDQHDKVIVVDVEGSHLGPSRYAIPRDSRLHDLLDYIEVDRELANVDAVSIKRSMVAARQKAALESSLQRLEARYLTASSQTDQEASIRAQEAQLIGQFVENTRNIEPNGRLVVARNGRVANILLQSGDTITIPPVSDSVLLSGEVLVSQAVLFESGMRARDYIALSGGFSNQADTKRLVLVHANGEVSSGENPTVSAGDEIIVLPKVPVKNLQIASTIVDIVYKIAIAASVAVKL